MAIVLKHVVLIVYSRVIEADFVATGNLHIVT